MEEKKLAKKIPFGVETKSEKKDAEQNSGEHKLTYEQLNDACIQLQMQNRKLIQQVQQMNMTNMFKRLDYLFEVLKAESVIKDADFINSCVQEIKEALTIVNDGEDKEEK